MDASSRTFVSCVKEKTDIQDRIAPLLLSVFSGLALFALTAAWPAETHDGITHTKRIESLTGALRAGVIFPRWFPDHMLGYGTPVLNYYSPGFYYPPALLHFAGLDLILSIRIALSLGFGISAWWMFRLSRLFVTVWPAMVSVICFQFFPYRIYDFFVRGAFPEFSAFFWLPPIAFYTLQTASLDWKTREWPSISLKLTIIGLAWAGLIVTHNLTALMGVLLLGATLLVFMVYQHREHSSFIRITVSSIVPVAIGIVLTAWYVLPALLELGWVLNGNRLFSGIGMGHFLKWSELIEFQVSYSYSFPNSRPRLPVYVIPIALAALAIVLTTKSLKLRNFTLMTTALTLGLVWAMTDTSRWLWTRSELFFDQVQFPWRWQIFAALGVALLLAASIESLRRKGRSWAKGVPLLSLFVAIYLFAYASFGLNYTTSEEAPNVAHWSDSFGAMILNSSMNIWAQHLLPIWSATPMVDAVNAGRKPWEGLTVPDPISSIAVTPTRTGLLQQQYMVTTDQTFRLLFHQFYFPPWRVSVDGIQVDVQPATGLGLASVTVPPGAHSVDIAWGTTAAVWMGRLVTAAGWLVVFILLGQTSGLLLFLRRGNGIDFKEVRRFWLSFVWLAIGGLMLLAVSGFTERTRDVSAIAADYGFVRLEGVRSIPPLRAGEVAPVHLTWLAKGPGEPVSAFVHLVDETGNGLSQDDGPPGGKNTPFQSWMAGLILHSTHKIAIPDSLPPGRYRLIAGLYYPDLSHEPIVPMNGDNPRLEIGSLEVLP